MNPDIAIRRLRNQNLLGNPFRRPEDAVKWLGAVQAEDYAGAKWAVGQRVKNCVDSDVEQAYVQGKILRTHIMRPTWHFVTPDDIRWMQELTASRVHAANAYWYRKLGLDDTIFKHSTSVFAGALKNGRHLTRVELAKDLKEAGINATGLRRSYLFMHAELDGLLCSGEPRGKQHTYTLLEERASSGKLERDEALAELTKRYFRSHGPALLKDFAWWSGLTMADAKAGVEMNKPDLKMEALGDKSYWFASPALSNGLTGPTVHLLPNLDEFLIAYKDHGPSFDKPLREGSALYKILSRHIIVVNGRVVGGWRVGIIRKNELRVEAKLLVRLNRAQHNAFRLAVERYGEFLGSSVTLRIIP